MAFQKNRKPDLVSEAAKLLDHVTRVELLEVAYHLAAQCAGDNQTITDRLLEEINLGREARSEKSLRKTADGYTTVTEEEERLPPEAKGYPASLSRKRLGIKLMRSTLLRDTAIDEALPANLSCRYGLLDLIDSNPNATLADARKCRNVGDLAIRALYESTRVRKE